MYSIRLAALAVLAAASTSALAASGYILETERMLDKLGYKPGRVDGEFDAELTAALKRFQADNRLQETGLVDPLTHEVLVAAVAPPSAQTQPSMPVAPAPAPQQPVSTPRTETVVGRGWQPAGRVGFLIEGAGEFGGGKVATVEFADGSTQDVRAGQGITLGGGLFFRPTSLLDLRATVGFKLVTTKADNADITLTRFVLKQTGDLLLPRGFRIGGGLVEHLNVKFDSGGLGGDGKFKNALGVVGGAGWRWVAVTYTLMDYEVKGGGGKVSANNLGVNFSWEF